MKTALRLLAVTGLLAAVVAGGAWILSRPRGAPVPRARLSVAAALGVEADRAFARALRPRPFAFPRDHGPHPAFRTEWWYYTGNLAAAGDRRFGFQLTFFRRALTAKPAPRASAWAASQAYMAHFALTDVAARRFHAFERVSRGALDLAGATAEPFRVWMEDWSATGLGPAGLPMRLRAAAGGVAIDLALRSAKPVVLEGDRGLSRKGAEPGNASYYYSLTRLETEGTITLDGAAWPVRGSSWMDREWGTSALGPDEAGWDWFALQLDDGRDVMFYRLRRRDGQTDPFSAGTLVAADGSTRPLAASAVTVEPLATWRSPRTGGVYPSRWRVRIPAAGLDLLVTPRGADQELDLGLRYWEGAVTVTGRTAGRPVAGEGYVELTGYESGR